MEYAPDYSGLRNEWETNTRDEGEQDTFFFKKFDSGRKGRHWIQAE